MAEASSSGMMLENLNLKIAPKDAKPETGIPSMFGAAERQIRFGRRYESQVDGVIGTLEDVARLYAAEFGFGQTGSEMKAFGKALKGKEAKEKIKVLFKTELEGKTPESQAEFISGGMGSLKEVALKLMKVRSEASDVSVGAVVTEISKLNKDYWSASAEDRKAIDGFLKEMSQARKDTQSTMSEMWDAQENMDIVNKIRVTMETGNRDIKRADDYQFKMTGGAIRKTVSWLGRAVNPMTTLRRGSQMFRNSSVVDREQTWARLDTLKAKAWAMGSPVENVGMWKAGIVSSKELGLTPAEVDKFVADKVLTDKQAAILREGREYKKYSNSQGEFTRTSEPNEYDYYRKFFGTRTQQAESAFKLARDKYLKFDISNLQNETDWALLQGAAGVAVDLTPIPQWFKGTIAKAAAMGGEGVVTAFTGAAEGLQFGIDRVEAVIAGDALESMTAVALARKMVTDKFNGLLASGSASEKDLLQSAKEVRGGWSVFERSSALKAARAADTTSMAEGEGLLVSALLSPAEVVEAGIDMATGGVFFGEHTAKVAKEMHQVIINSVDGKGVMKGLENKNIDPEISANAQDKVSTWIDNKTAELKIPEAYNSMQSMKRFLRDDLRWGDAIEKFRQAIGPEAKFPLPFEIDKKLGLDKLLNKLKNTEFWEVVAGGSKRQSVDQVIGKVRGRMDAVADGIEYYKAESGNTENPHAGVEAATVIVLREALQKNATVELRQVSERARLDKMYDSALKTGEVGVVLGAIAVGAGLIGVATEKWSDNWHMKLGVAEENLKAFKTIFDANFPTIPEIVNPVHEDWARAGAQGQLGGLQNEVWWKNWQSNVVGGIDWTVAKTALTAKVATALTPVVVAARSAFEVLSGRIRPKTKLFAPTGEIK